MSEIWSTELPIPGEPAEVAEARLKQDAEAFKRKQADEKALIAARDAKARQDAIDVANALAEDTERRLVGEWERKLNRHQQYDLAPEGVSDEELEERRIALGIPLAALTADDGSRGFGAVVCQLWARTNEHNARQVERERNLARAAVLQRQADQILEWEARHADQEKLEN